jgi:hypothetical protein
MNWFVWEAAQQTLRHTTNTEWSCLAGQQDKPANPAPCNAAEILGTRRGENTKEGSTHTKNVTEQREREATAPKPEKKERMEQK